MTLLSTQPLARRARLRGSRTALGTAEQVLLRCSLSPPRLPLIFPRPQSRHSFLSWPFPSWDRKRQSTCNVFRSRSRSLSQQPSTKGFFSSLLSCSEPPRGGNRLGPPDGESGLGRARRRYGSVFQRQHPFLPLAPPLGGVGGAQEKATFCRGHSVSPPLLPPRDAPRSPLLGASRQVALLTIGPCSSGLASSSSGGPLNGCSEPGRGPRTGALQARDGADGNPIRERSEILSLEHQRRLGLSSLGSDAKLT